MSTQPTNNTTQMQIIALSEVHNHPFKMDQWQYVLDALAKAPAKPEPAIKLTFRNRYSAAVCTREMRSLISSRGVPVGISHRGLTVCVWRLT